MAATVFDKFLIPADKDRVVAQVNATALGTVSTNPQEPNVFHWRIYLTLAPADGETESQSVLLDMFPTNPPVGTLVISSEPTATSTTPAKIELSLAPAQPLTVREVIDFFISKGMHRYKYDDTGSGCLYWLWTGIQHLQDAQLVEAGAVQKLQAFHAEQARLHPERHPLPIRQGQFY